MAFPETSDRSNAHYLLPGNLFAHRDPYMVSTVLGSCISIILLDQINRVSGINHYMLPLWNGEGLPTPKYGNIAIAKLIEKMISLGADKKNMKAKVFGGSTLHGNPKGLLDIGNRNIEISRDYLYAEDIPILVSDVGGNRGRKLIFNMATGGVKIKMLGTSIMDQEGN